MASWQEYTLKQLLTEKGYIRGPFGSALKRGQMQQSGIPVYEQQHAITKSRVFRYFIGEEKFEELRRFKTEPNDLIISCSGTIGEVSIIKENDPEGIISQALLTLRPNTKLLSATFLYYFFKSQEGLSKLLAASHGSVQNNIANRATVEAIRLKVPDIATQDAITEILSSLDDKIELNNQINQNLEALAQAIFKRWFVDFEFPNENGQPYKSSGGEMVESELGEIPKNWSVCAFRDSVDVVRGLSYKGAGLVSEGEGVPMHNLNSVYEGGGYKYEGIKYYSREYKEHHRIVPWDLIVTNTEQGHKYLLIGYPAFVPKTMGDSGIFSHHIYKVKALPNSGISNQFLLYLIMTPDVRDQIIGCANGTTVNMLKIEGLQRPKFVKPNKDTIGVFTNLICDIWEQLENNYLQNRNLAKLRDSLLPKLISGEVTVSEKTKVMAS